MHRKNVVFGLGLSVIAAGSLILLGCTVDFTPPCCPTGVVFSAQDPWVCPSNCPGGGVTRLDYEIQFEQEGEACDPGEDFTIFIQNLTDDIELPPLVWDNPDVGTYQGQLEITLEHDTTFRIEATRETVNCGAANAELTVMVVDQGDSHQISLSGILDPGDGQQCTLQGGLVPFGPGVKIDYIENLTPFNIRVDKDGMSDLVAPNGQGYGLQNEPASGNWSIGISSLSDCTRYADLPIDQQVLKIKVFLQCDCPPAP